MLFFHRLVAAFTTLPSGKGWLLCSLFFLAFITVATSFGATTRFFRWEITTAWRKFVQLTIVSLFFPSLVEESLFRAMLLPYAGEKASSLEFWAWVGLSMSAYLGSHVVNAVITGKRLFVDARFLGLTLALGLTCTATYVVSGSIWPCVLVHWIVVAVWLTLLGGSAAIEASR